MIVITGILNIRIKQLIRIILQIGIIRTIFLLGLFVFILLYIFITLSEKSNQEFIVGVYVLLLLSIQIKRKDKVFLNIYTKVPQSIFLFEYILLSLPILIPLIYYGLWIYLLFFIICLIIIPFLKISIKKSSVNSVFQRIIPNENFEWKSGIRKNLVPFIGIWFIGLSMSFFVASVPIVIFVLGMIVLNFYEKPEPLQILLADELGVKRFLIKKIKKHLILFFILIIPLILSFLIFNLEYYYIPLIEYVMFSILLIYTILLKYAFYQPNNKSGAMQIFTMIGVISLFIPVFIPLILFLSMKFAFQASNNLNFFLNDFN
jgi:hypothetical protein